jgi:hypothetical protein
VLENESYGESVRLLLAVAEERDAALRAALADLRLEPVTPP